MAAFISSLMTPVIPDEASKRRIYSMAAAWLAAVEKYRPYVQHMTAMCA